MSSELNDNKMKHEKKWIELQKRDGNNRKHLKRNNSYTATKWNFRMENIASKNVVNNCLYFPIYFLVRPLLFWIPEHRVLSVHIITVLFFLSLNSMCIFFSFKHFRIEFHVSEQTTERHGTKIPKMWNNIQWNYYWKNERKIKVSSFSLSRHAIEIARHSLSISFAKRKTSMHGSLFLHVNTYCFWMRMSTLMRAWLFTFETKSQYAPEIEAITVFFFDSSRFFHRVAFFANQIMFNWIPVHSPWNSMVLSNIWFQCNNQPKYMHGNWI